MGTARRKIKALWQTLLASAYFTQFQQYLAILGWKDQDPIIDRDMDGLKSNLKDNVVCIRDQPTSVAGLIAFVVPLDNRLQERDQERKQVIPVVVSKPFEGSQNISSEGPALSCATDTTSHVATPSPSPTPTSQHVPTGNPASPICGPLTAGERTRRMDEGLCLYCGKAGHSAIDCPIKRQFPRPPLRSSTTTLTLSPVLGNGKGPTM